MSFHVLLMTISSQDIDPKDVEAKLDKAKDWLRYAPGCWLIYTGQSAETWYERLSDVVKVKGALVFLCEANVEERSGKLSPEAWKWMKSIREQKQMLAS